MCRAYQLGQPEALGAARPKGPSERVAEVAVVVWRGKRVLVRQCAGQERWAGLWDFPRFPLSPPNRDVGSQLAAAVRQMSGIDIKIGDHLATIRHTVTRFHITLRCYAAQYKAGALANRKDSPLKWLQPKELEEYPMSTPGRKLARLLAGADKV